MTIRANIFIYGPETSETLAQAMELDAERKWGKNQSGEALTYKDPKIGKAYNSKFDIKVQLLDKANPQRSLSSSEKYFQELGDVGSNYIEIKTADKRSAVAFNTPFTKKGVGTLLGRVMTPKIAPRDWAHELGHVLGGLPGIDSAWYSADNRTSGPPR